MTSRPAGGPAAKPGRIGRRLSGRTISLDRLSASEIDALAERLFRVHSSIFRGIAQAEFIGHVLRPPALRSKIRLFESPEGEIAGYCAMHTYARPVRGRPALVLRGETGLLPDYRGRGASYGFGMAYAFKEKLRHPFTAVYYLGTLVHPSSYHLFYKYFPTVYPHPAKGFPARQRALAVELIESFPDAPVAPSDPLVRDVGWITVETPQERKLILESHRPDLRLFVARNPGYPSGHGLVVSAPISFGNIVAAIYSRLREVILARLRIKSPRL